MCKTYLDAGTYGTQNLLKQAFRLCPCQDCQDLASAQPLTRPWMPGKGWLTASDLL